jgi:hypothetical protein
MPVDTNLLKNDVVKFTTILLVIHVITKKRNKQKLFDNKSVTKIAYWVAGIFIYYYVVSKYMFPVLPPLAAVAAPVAA